MSLNLTNSDTFNQLFSPLHESWKTANHQYKCHKLPDEDWVQAGVLRVLDDLRTGCGFLQKAHLTELLTTSKSHYFTSFKSKRRLNHLRSISQQFLEQQSQLAFKNNPTADLHESLKNKLYEQKAWAKSYDAKRMQAHFITLSYNLAKLLSERIEKEENLRDEVNIKKKETRLDDLLEKSSQLKTEVPSLRKEYQKASQLSVKFYRWLRVYILNPGSWQQSLRQLKLIYNNF